MKEEHLTAWLGLGIAAFVALIGVLQFLTARRQWRTANNRAVFDVFQKRYEVYQEFREIVGRVTGSGRADSMMFLKAAEAKEKAQFLFGEEVVRYLDEFTNAVRDLECYGMEEHSLQGDDLTKNRAAQRQFRDSIEEFRTKGVKLFAPYIRFDHKIS